MKGNQYVRLLLLTGSFVLCACILLIGMKGVVPVWMYVLPAVPVSVFIANRLFKQGWNHVWNLMFWIFFLTSFIVFWFNPKMIAYCTLNGFSFTALAFFIVTIAFSIAAPRSSINSLFGYRTPVTMSDPKIWTMVHNTMSNVCFAFALPLFLLIFYVSGVTKFSLSVVCFLGGIVGGGMIGELKAKPLISEIRQKEKEELEKQIKKEQGYR